MNVLIIEDNVELSGAMAKLCARQPNISKVDVAYDGEEGLYYAVNNEYDIILLDIMLPKINGLELLKRLRQTKECGVCMVSAINEKETLVEALKLGADDYITKPFDSDELIARIDAIYRRRNNQFAKNLYEYKSLKLDYSTMTLTINGEVVVLNGKLYDIFEYLVNNKNTIVTKDRLFNRVWGFDSDTIYTVTEVYISKLRKLLDKFGLKNNLVTIKNIGYMWDETK